MKLQWMFLGLCLILGSCSHTNSARKVAQEVTPDAIAISADVPNPEDTTVWLLKDLAEKKRFDVLNFLYNNRSLHLDRLPVGYAAGTGARVFDMNSDKLTKLLDSITGKMWKGKIFFESQNKLESRGLNRIRTLLGGHIVPMGSFVTKIVEAHPLVPEVEKGHSLVLLNYADPARREYPYIQEELLKQIHVYDLMVAVPGKYGPVFVGKTWLGKYSKTDGEFSTEKPNELIAWYFLDFNPAALDEQQKNHWNAEVEEYLNPLPKVLETTVPYK